MPRRATIIPPYQRNTSPIRLVIAAEIPTEALAALQPPPAQRQPTQPSLPGQLVKAVGYFVIGLALPVVPVALLLLALIA